MRKLRLTGASAALAVAALLAGTSGAEAASYTPPGYYLLTAAQCEGGTKVGDRTLVNQLGETQGRQVVYRHSSGMRCALTYHHAGAPTQTRVNVRRDIWQTVAYDTGVFQYYAGAVGSYGCIYVSSHISLGSHSVDQFRSPTTKYC
ncbi:MAG TPA: hypothetical protein VGD67_24575 [Pseudonocardiaceae bacterium]